MKRYLISLLLLSAAALTLAGCDGKSRSTSVWNDGDGSANKPYLIYTAEDMNAVRGGVPGYEGWGLDKHYVLARDIDLSGYAGGEGWVPIGTGTTPFTGSFDGNGRVISGLVINRPGSDYQGLFGYAGTAAVLKNVALSSVNVDGNALTGSLAGYNNGTIVNSSAIGTVSGGFHTGGLVGYNDTGSISGSYATGTVIGNEDIVGGLVGADLDGTISNNYATGAVSGVNYVGGLVGETDHSTISDSYATGAVRGDIIVGGLVGHNLWGPISDSYATGAVSGNDYVGGLVGWNSWGPIKNNYAAGAVSGNSSVGGLMGHNFTGPISNNYATGSVSGGIDVGGLVGGNFSGTISTSYATGVLSGSSHVGGLVGLFDSGSISYSYWITDNMNGLDLFGLTSTGTSTGCLSLSDAQGKQQASFSGWDFVDAWRIEEGVSYPELQWQQ